LGAMALLVLAGCSSGALDKPDGGSNDGGAVDAGCYFAEDAGASACRLLKLPPAGLGLSKRFDAGVVIAASGSQLTVDAGVEGAVTFEWVGSDLTSTFPVGTPVRGLAEPSHFTGVESLSHRAIVTDGWGKIGYGHVPPSAPALAAGLAFSAVTECEWSECLPSTSSCRALHTVRSSLVVTNSSTSVTIASQQAATIEGWTIFNAGIVWGQALGCDPRGVADPAGQAAFSLLRSLP